MSVNEKKLHFLKTEFIPLLGNLKSTDKGLWGVMNAQQMVEHFIDAIKLASGKINTPVLNEGETLEKYRQFLMTESPFRENTKNPLMKEEGELLRAESMHAAVSRLQSELNHFFEVYESDTSLKKSNPFFGELDYEQQVQLLYKHAVHHLRQFGRYSDNNEPE